MTSEIEINNNFRKILYERQSDDDSVIGPYFLSEYIQGMSL